jgi:hypothetical protein
MTIGSEKWRIYMEKIIVTEEQYDFMMELEKNPPKPTKALIKLMNQCQLCSSKAEVGEMSLQYSEELDKMVVVKDLYCNECQQKLKRGIKF